MKITRFIKITIENLEAKKFSLTEQEKYNSKVMVYNILKGFGNDITIEKFCETMVENKLCPNEIQSSFKCKDCTKECKICWQKYLEKRLEPFQNLSIYSVLHNNEDTKKNIEIVKSKDYIEWLYEYLKENKNLNSENILYEENKKNAEYGGLLFLFLLYINDLIDETDLENLADYNEYEAEKYNLKIKDKYYELCVITGQGSILFISELSDLPNNFLDLSVGTDGE